MECVCVGLNFLNFFPQIEEVLEGVFGLLQYAVVQLGTEGLFVK